MTCFATRSSSVQQVPENAPAGLEGLSDRGRGPRDVGLFGVPDLQMLFRPEVVGVVQREVQALSSIAVRVPIQTTVSAASAPGPSQGY